MSRHIQTLAQITDGKAAWSEFFTGVQDTFAKNASDAPVIAAVVGVIILILVDIKIAKWIVRSFRSPKRTTKDTR